MFMSDDERARALDRADKSIAQLKSHLPLSSAIAVPESLGAAEERSDECDVPAFLLQLLGSGVCVNSHAPIFNGQIYVTVTAAPAGSPASEANRAYAVFRGLSSAMVGIVRGLGAAVRTRLHLSDAIRDHGTWERILFHLAWHFPHHFPGGNVRRFRYGRFGELPEELLQLWRYNGPLEERFPRLMFSVMTNPLDLAAATECAIQLIREATSSGCRPPADWRDRLRELRPSSSDTPVKPVKSEMASLTYLLARGWSGPIRHSRPGRRPNGEAFPTLAEIAPLSRCPGAGAWSNGA